MAKKAISITSNNSGSRSDYRLLLEQLDGRKRVWLRGQVHSCKPGALKCIFPGTLPLTPLASPIGGLASKPRLENQAIPQRGVNYETSVGVLMSSKAGYFEEEHRDSWSPNRIATTTWLSRVNGPTLFLLAGIDGHQSKCLKFLARGMVILG